MLHELVDIDGLVEGFCLYIAGKLYELAGKELLGDDAGMILHMGRRSHASRDFGYISRATYFLKSPVTPQLFGNGEHINGFLGHSQVADSLENVLVALLVEALGEEHLAHHGVGILVDKQSANDGTLYL